MLGQTPRKWKGERTATSHDPEAALRGPWVLILPKGVWTAAFLAISLKPGLVCGFLTAVLLQFSDCSPQVYGMEG